MELQLRQKWLGPELCVEGGLANRTKMDRTKLRIEDGLEIGTKKGRLPIACWSCSCLWERKRVPLPLFACRGWTCGRVGLQLGQKESPPPFPIKGGLETRTKMGIVPQLCIEGDFQLG